MPWIQRVSGGSITARCVDLCRSDYQFVQGVVRPLHGLEAKKSPRRSRLWYFAPRCMSLDLDIDLSDLAVPPAELHLDLGASTSKVLGAISFDGVRVRMPLAVFHSPSIRREIERQLSVRELRPQWELARKSVDDAGAPIRLVSVVRSEHLRS